MRAIRLTDARYQFPSSGEIGPFTLEVDAGELVVLAGPTGSGKSTLIRMIAGLAQRHGHGRVSGLIEVCGRDPGTLSGTERVQILGFVGQEVDDCVLAGTCAGEVSFALESAGLSAALVGPALHRVGLGGFEARDPLQISGGERQRLAIAAALAARPRILLLDEPLSQLDPEGARAIVQMLRSIADSGVGIVLVEHRLSLLGCADRVVHLAAGDEPALEGGTPKARGMFHVERRGQEPPVLVASNASYAHDRARGVRGVNLAVHAGERVAVVGDNGAGKSTLLGLLSGRLRPASGSIATVGPALEVPQNADLILFSNTAADEVAYAAVEKRWAPDPLLLAGFGLAGADDRAPQALSRGQRLRLAVAAVTAARPSVLLLDEAGSGQDSLSLARLFEAIRERSGTTVFSSHDPELVRGWATRVVWLADGKIVDDQPTGSSRWPGASRTGRDAGEGSGPLDLESSDPRSTVAALPESDGVLAQRLGASRRLDPRLRVALVVEVGLLVILFEGTLPLALLALTLLTAAVSHPGARGWRRGILVGAALLAWSTAFSQSLFWADWPRTPLFAIAGLTFWKQGALHGLAQSTRFIAVSAAGVLLALSTPTDELITALRSRIGRWTVPFPLVVMVAAMVRFVPLVAVEWAQVRRARRARGRAIWRRSPAAWLSLEVSLLRPVVARCVRRARMLAESLETRGFDPASPRGIARPLVWRAADTATLGLAVTTLFSVAVCRTLYVLYTADLWYDSRLRPLYAFVRAFF